MAWLARLLIFSVFLVERQALQGSLGHRASELSFRSGTGSHWAVGVAGVAGVVVVVVVAVAWGL